MSITEKSGLVFLGKQVSIPSTVLSVAGDTTSSNLNDIYNIEMLIFSLDVSAMTAGTLNVSIEESTDNSNWVVMNNVESGNISNPINEGIASVMIPPIRGMLMAIMRSFACILSFPVTFE